MIAATEEVTTTRLTFGLPHQHVPFQAVSLALPRIPPGTPTSLEQAWGYPLVLLHTLQNSRRPVRRRPNQLLRIFHSRSIKRARGMRDRIDAFHSLIECAIVHDIFDDDIIECLGVEEVDEELALRLRADCASNFVAFNEELLAHVAGKSVMGLWGIGRLTLRSVKVSEGVRFGGGNARNLKHPRRGRSRPWISRPC